MSRINIDKVRQIAGTVLGEQGKTLYISPVIYAIALLIVVSFIDNAYTDIIEDVIKFTIPMSMIIPTLLIIKKFVGDNQVQRTAELPASILDRYAAMLAAVAIQSVIWFVIIFAAAVVLLIIASSILFGVEASAVLALIFNPMYLRFIIPMMFIAALVGWGRMASVIKTSRRIADYVLIALSFAGYLLILPVFINQSERAVILSLSVYSAVIMLLAVIRSYYNFKKIISDVNK